MLFYVAEYIKYKDIVQHLKVNYIIVNIICSSTM